MTRLIACFFVFCSSLVFGQVTYYFDGGFTDNLSDWWSVSPGVGTNPASFALDNTTWCLCVDETFTYPITITGTGTKVVVDNATIEEWDLTLGTGVVLDITSTGSVEFNGTGSFNLGTLESGSTLIINELSQAIPAGTYGNLIFESSGDSPTFSGTYTIANDLINRTDATLNLGSATWNITGDITGDSDINFGTGNVTVGGDVTYSAGYPTLDFNAATVDVTGSVTGNDHIYFGESTTTIGGNLSALYINYDIFFESGVVNVTGNVSSNGDVLLGTGTYTIGGNVVSTYSSGLVDFQSSNVTVNGSVTANAGSSANIDFGSDKTTVLTNVTAGGSLYMGSDTTNITGNVIVNGTYLDFETSTVTIGGTLTAADEVLFGTKSSTVTGDFTGTGTIATIDLQSSDMTFSGNFTAADKVNMGSGTHTIAGSLTGLPDILNFQTSSVDITGDITVSDDILFGTGTHTVGGTVSSSGTISLIDFEGSGSVTVTGSVSGGDNVHLGEGTVIIGGNLATTASSSQLFFQGSNATVTGNVTGSGDIELNTSTANISGNIVSSASSSAYWLDFNSSNTTVVGDVTVNGSGEVWFGTATLDIGGDLNIGASTYEVQWEDGVISLEGDLDNDLAYGSFTFYFGTSPSITFDGTGASSFESVSANVLMFPKITVTKTGGGTVTLGNNIKLDKGLIVNSGEMSTATNTLTLSSLGATINGGTLNAASSGTLTLTSVGLNNTGGTLEVENSGTATIGGALTNSSTVTVAGTLNTSSTTSNAAASTITIDGGTWNATGTVSNTGTTTVQSGGDATFSSTFTNESSGVFTISGGEATASTTITNNATATMNLASSGVFTAVGNVTNNGTINVAHATSFIQGNSSGLSGSGDFVVSITSPTQWTDLFSYFSSPITDGTIGWGGDVTGNAHYSFRKGGEGNPDWTAIGAAETMTPGEGYAVLDADHITFTGTANNGDVAVSIAKNTNETNNHLWNLVGNPYPSPINATDLIADNADMGGAIYVWDQAANSGDLDHSGYAVVNNVGSVGSAGYYTDSITAANYWIATGQGFMIESLNTTGTVTFKNTYRLDDDASHNNNSLKNLEQEMMRYKITAEQNGSGSAALLAFDETATEGYDRLFDARALEGSNVNNTFQHNELGELAIQGLPFPKDSLAIPMMFTGTAGSPVTLSMKELDEFPPNYRFYFVDTIQNITLPINDNIIFYPTTDTYPYFISLQNPDYVEVGVEDITLRTTSTQWINSNGAWTLQSDAPLNGTVTHYNLLGQKTMEQDVKGTNLFQLDPKIQPGILHYVSKTGNVITQKTQ